MTNITKQAVKSIETHTIKPPEIRELAFHIQGDAPLVIHRFSAKTKAEMLQKIVEGSKPSRGKKVHAPKSPETVFNEARYISKDGWDGFNASSLRNALISACRVSGFMMSRAKMSIFVRADGWDALEPQIPLVRIYGECVMQQDMARVETGQPYIAIRPAYHDWSANIRVRYDAGQFSAQDVSSLLMRAGLQVGIGEGRPDSKNSAGMGWGTFVIGNPR